MQPWRWISLYIACTLSRSTGAPVMDYVAGTMDVTTREGQIAYLRRFGYLHEELQNVVHIDLEKENDKFAQVIKHFQEMAAIPQTGVLDSATVEMMLLPRCGVRDDEEDGDFSLNKTRHKRFSLHGSRWSLRDLYYKITDYTSKMSHAAVDREIARAFKTWSDHSSLNFIQVHDGPANIEIKFARGNHGDEYPFDGQGTVLAHAFYPFFGGNTHLDEDESWTDNTTPGSTNLFRVIVHELGHSLGLKHSSVPTAVMHELYKRNTTTTFSLDRDDINGIQALYGPPPIVQDNSRTTTTTSTRAPLVTPRSSRPDYCNLQKLDAITRYDDGHDYAFAGGQYYKLGPQGVVGAPRVIQERLPGVPNNLNSALYWDPPNDEAYGIFYMFKGSQVWWITENRLHGPFYISQIFPGIPDNIDASFVWTGNKRTYFFKGNEYYRLAVGSRAVDAGYPKPLSIWNLQGPIDSASLTSKGDTYFFKGTRYYRYSGNLLQNADPSPKSTTVELFNCAAAGSLKEGPSPPNSDVVNTEEYIKDQGHCTLGDDLIVVKQESNIEQIEELYNFGLPSKSTVIMPITHVVCLILITVLCLLY